jgi:AraC-like DNA-binding protein
MDIFINHLHNLIMPYFSGIEWVSHGRIPACTAWVDKEFKDYYCLNYAHQGSLKWRINRQRFVTLRAPVAWWTYPGPWFEYGHREGAPWNHRYVCFRGERVRQFINKGLLPLKGDKPWVKIEDPQAFEQVFANLHEVLEDWVHRPQQSVHLLEGLLVLLTEQPIAPTEKRKDEKMRKLAAAIRLSPAQEWNFPIEARRLGFSFPHFFRLFRHATGLPPRQYVIRCRLEAAARRLREGELALKEIAEKIGYPDIYYFSRLFRKHFGVPPGKYRRETVVLGDAAG